MAVETVVRNNLRNRAYTVIGGGMQVQVIDGRIVYVIQWLYRLYFSGE